MPIYGGEVRFTLPEEGLIVDEDLNLIAKTKVLKPQPNQEVVPGKPSFSGPLNFSAEI